MASLQPHALTELPDNDEIDADDQRKLVEKELKNCARLEKEQDVLTFLSSIIGTCATPGSGVQQCCLIFWGRLNSTQEWDEEEAQMADVEGDADALQAHADLYNFYNGRLYTIVRNLMSLNLQANVTDIPYGDGEALCKELRTWVMDTSPAAKAVHMQKFHQIEQRRDEPPRKYCARIAKFKVNMRNIYAHIITEQACMERAAAGINIRFRDARRECNKITFRPGATLKQWRDKFVTECNIIIADEKRDARRDREERAQKAATKAAKKERADKAEMQALVARIKTLENQRGKGANPKNNKKYGAKTCYHCLEEGHYARECKNACAHCGSHDCPKGRDKTCGAPKYGKKKKKSNEGGGGDGGGDGGGRRQRRRRPAAAAAAAAESEDDAEDDFDFDFGGFGFSARAGPPIREVSDMRQALIDANKPLDFRPSATRGGPGRAVQEGTLNLDFDGAAGSELELVPFGNERALDSSGGSRTEKWPSCFTVFKHARDWAKEMCARAWAKLMHTCHGNSAQDEDFRRQIRAQIETFRRQFDALQQELARLFAQDRLKRARGDEEDAIYLGSDMVMIEFRKQAAFSACVLYMEAMELETQMLDQLARFKHYTSGKYDDSDDALNGTEDWLDGSQLPNHEDNYEGDHYEGARRKHVRCVVEAWHSKEHRTLAEIRQDWLTGRDMAFENIWLRFLRALFVPSVRLFEMPHIPRASLVPPIEQRRKRQRVQNFEGIPRNVDEQEFVKRGQGEDAPIVHISRDEERMRELLYRLNHGDLKDIIPADLEWMPSLPDGYGFSAFVPGCVPEGQYHLAIIHGQHPASISFVMRARSRSAVHGTDFARGVQSAILRMRWGQQHGLSGCKLAYFTYGNKYADCKLDPMDEEEEASRRKADRTHDGDLADPRWGNKLDVVAAAIRIAQRRNYTDARTRDFIDEFFNRDFELLYPDADNDTGYHWFQAVYEPQISEKFPVEFHKEHYDGVALNLLDINTEDFDGVLLGAQVLEDIVDLTGAFKWVNAGPDYHHTRAWHHEEQQAPAITTLGSADNQDFDVTRMVEILRAAPRTTMNGGISVDTTGGVVRRFKTGGVGDIVKQSELPVDYTRPEHTSYWQVSRLWMRAVHILTRRLHNPPRAATTGDAAADVWILQLNAMDLGPMLDPAFGTPCRSGGEEAAAWEVRHWTAEVALARHRVAIWTNMLLLAQDQYRTTGVGPNNACKTPPYWPRTHQAKLDQLDKYHQGPQEISVEQRESDMLRYQRVEEQIRLSLGDRRATLTMRYVDHDRDIVSIVQRDRRFDSRMLPKVWLHEVFEDEDAAHIYDMETRFKDGTRDFIMDSTRRLKDTAELGRTRALNVWPRPNPPPSPPRPGGDGDRDAVFGNIMEPPPPPPPPPPPQPSATDPEAETRTAPTAGSILDTGKANVAKDGADAEAQGAPRLPNSGIVTLDVSSAFLRPLDAPPGLEREQPRQEKGRMRVPCKEYGEMQKSFHENSGDFDSDNFEDLQADRYERDQLQRPRVTVDTCMDWLRKAITRAFAERGDDAAETIMQHVDTFEEQICGMYEVTLDQLLEERQRERREAMCEAFSGKFHDPKFKRIRDLYEPDVRVELERIGWSWGHQTVHGAVHIVRCIIMEQAWSHKLTHEAPADKVWKVLRPTLYSMGFRYNVTMVKDLFAKVIATITTCHEVRFQEVVEDASLKALYSTGGLEKLEAMYPIGSISGGAGARYGYRAYRLKDTLDPKANARVPPTAGSTEDSGKCNICHDGHWRWNLCCTRTSCTERIKGWWDQVWQQTELSKPAPQQSGWKKSKHDLRDPETAPLRPPDEYYERDLETSDGEPRDINVVAYLGDGVYMGSEFALEAVYDTGCTHNMTGNKDLFIGEITPEQRRVTCANGEVVMSSGIGNTRYGRTLYIEGFDTLVSVRQLVADNKHWVSIDKNGLCVHNEKDKVVHKVKLDRGLYREDTNPQCAESEAKICGFSARNIKGGRPLNTATYLHLICGHRNTRRISKLMGMGHLKGIVRPTKREILQQEADGCPECIKAKGHRNAKDKPSHVREYKPFERVHVDTVHNKTPSIDGDTCVVTFTDSGTGWTQTNTIRSANAQDVIDAMAELKLYYENVPGKGPYTMKTLYVDKGTEFDNAKVKRWCKRNRIDLRFAPPSVSMMNQPAETTNKHVMAEARAMMKTSNLPIGYWPFALRHATMLRCVMPTHRNPGGKSPFFMVHGYEAAVHHILRIFGCTAYALKSAAQLPRGDKFADRTLPPMQFVGYNLRNKVWMLLDVKTGKLKQAAHVMFDESEKRRREIDNRRKKDQFYSIGTGITKVFNGDVYEGIITKYRYRERQRNDDKDVVSEGLYTIKYEDSDQEELNTEQIHNLICTQQGRVAEERAASATVEPRPQCFAASADDTYEATAFTARALGEAILNNEKMRDTYMSDEADRLEGLVDFGDIASPLPPYMSGGVKETWTTETASAAMVAPAATTEPKGKNAIKWKETLVSDIPVPSTMEEALRGPHAFYWRAAIDVELARHKEFGTFQGIDEIPQGQRIMKTTWAFAVKPCTEKENEGKVKKLKARLCGCGYSQIKGINFTKSYSPTPRVESIMLLLTLAAKKDYELHQIDYRSAFLQASLKPDEYVYVRTPKGVKSSHGLQRVTKAIYGTRQASFTWWKAIDKHIVAQGLTRTKSDPTCYVFIHSDGHISILLIHVDDMMLSAHKSHRKMLVRRLRSRFQSTDEGAASLFVGLHITRDRENRTITISNQSYIETALKRFNLDNATPKPTPMTSDTVLRKYSPPTTEENGQRAGPTEELADKVLYMQACGTAIWCSCLWRQDIMLPIALLCKYMTCPTKTHWTKLKHVYRYLKGTKALGLTLGGTGEYKLRGYADASYATDKDTARSISGHVWFYGPGGAISCSAKTQKIVATSTTEAEWIALNEAMREGMYLVNHLRELGEEVETPVTIYEDNQCVMANAERPSHSPRTKHMDVRYHFCRERIEMGEFKLEFVVTAKQRADGFTKPLVKILFNRNMKQVMSGDHPNPYFPEENENGGGAARAAQELAKQAQAEAAARHHEQHGPIVKKARPSSCRRHDKNKSARRGKDAMYKFGNLPRRELTRKEFQGSHCVGQQAAAELSGPESGAKRFERIRRRALRARRARRKAKLVKDGIHSAALWLGRALLALKDRRGTTHTRITDWIFAQLGPEYAFARSRIRLAVLEAMDRGLVSGALLLRHGRFSINAAKMKKGFVRRNL